MSLVKAKAYIVSENRITEDFFINPVSGLAVFIDVTVTGTAIIEKSPEEYIILPSSGILDKKNQLIYLGDILYTPGADNYCVVKFGDTYDKLEEGYYGWYCESIHKIKEYCQLNLSINYTSYVIGNIYLNPTILEQK